MKIGLVDSFATAATSVAILDAISPCSDAVTIAMLSILGASSTACSVILTRSGSLKMAAVTSIGLASEPNAGTKLRSRSVVAGASRGSCMPRFTHSSVIRMPAPPEIVMIATRLPAGSLPHANARL